MAINFPSSPIAGQFYPTSVINPGDPQWQFNSEGGWQRILSVGQVLSVFVGIGPTVELYLLALPEPFAPSQWTLHTHI